MGSQSSGGKSKKCQECRIRRIKCDLKLPQCSQCLSVGKSCSGPVSGNIFITMDGQKTNQKNAESSQRPNPQALSSDGSSSVQQLRLTPVQSVGLRDFDPFSTYPALPYPSEGIDRLVSFYLQVMGPRIISFNPRSTWFTSALTDPVLFQSTLYSAALYFNSLWRPGDSQLAVFHKAQLFGMINDRLRDVRQGLSDQTIAAVALIVYTEVVNGPIAEYATHMNGLTQMMSMRGQLGMSALLDFLQRMIASSSVFFAIRQNCITPAPLASPNEVDIATPCASSATDIPIHPSPMISPNTILGKLSQCGFHPDVLIAVNDLFIIVTKFHREFCATAADFHQADLDAQLLYTEHRLVKYQSAEICGDNEVQRSFCVACLIFVSLFLREMPGPVLLNEALNTRLRETMGNIDQTLWAEVPPEIMLWMLFMGGIVATGRPERLWFVSHLSKLESSPDFRDWDSVKASLQSVLWVYKIPEESFRVLCGEVVTLKI